MSDAPLFQDLYVARKRPEYTHRDKFSSYMAVVLGLVGPVREGMHSLDIPTGAGHLGDELKRAGYEHVNADINAGWC